LDHFLLFFLSRLLGGEVFAPAVPIAPVFLSRLLGGEAVTADDLNTSTFLSRLLGGEGSGIEKETKT